MLQIDAIPKWSKINFIGYKKKKNMETTGNSMQENNKDVDRKFWQYFENDKLNKIENELWASNYKLHFSGKNTDTPGGMEIIKSFKAAFPDIKFTIEEQVAEGDMVVSRVRAKGTHKGEYQGVAPTNKNVEFTVTAANRIVNYKIVERWTEIDALGILTQLGAVPELANQG